MTSTPGTLAVALLAALALFLPDETRAQASPPACTPAQTVSARPDADGHYTTTISCADTSAAADAADYRHLHYFQASSPGASVLTRDGSIPNNHWNNHVTLTIGSGVVFTADGYADMSVLNVDAAVSLATGSDKTIVVEEGAVINLERTPEFWSSSDPDRPAANAQYDPAWYPEWRDGLARLAGIHVGSQVTQGDVTVRHHGVINVDVALRGTYAGPPNTYGAFDGSAIRVFITDWDDGASRADRDILVELGPTGVIRHVEGSAGLSGIYAENRAEDGDVTIDLAEGSLIDVSHAGGSGVWAWTLPSRGYASGELAGDTVINARGAIRASVKHRMVSSNQGVGIVVFNAGEGRVHITSSGTIDTWQGNAIYGYPHGTTNTHHDDPATEEIESHLIDVTAGRVHTRGSTAIRALTGSPDDAWTIRVAEGALVRAERDAGPDAVRLEHLGASGNRYVWPPGTYGWRGVDTDSDGENDALEPIINAIALGQRTGTPRRSEGVADRVLVDGTVEAIGGKVDGDAAVLLERGGVVMVGESGRISADSGLAIAGGVAPPAEPPEDYEPTASDLSVTVAGMVEGDVETLDDGDLRLSVSGRVDGDVRAMGAGALTLAVLEGGAITGSVHDPAGPLTVHGSIGRLLYTRGGTVTVAATGRLTGVEGESDAVRSEAGDLAVTVAGTVAGDLRAPTGGALTLDVREGGAVTGTVHDPAGPLTVAGHIGRLLYTRGGTVTVAATGRLTGVEGESDAVRSEAGDLAVTVAGTVAGDLRALGGGDLDATISGTVEGDVRASGGGDLTLDVREGGAVTGTVHDPAGPLTVRGSIGRLLYTNGGRVTVAATGRLSGVEGEGRREAVRGEAGDLAVTVAETGRVSGDVRGMGEGSLRATVAGTLVGDVVEEGAGDLTATVSGRVEGDVLGRGTGEHTVTVAGGGVVTGTIHLSASTVGVDGTAGQVRFDRGGVVTVGKGGRLTGVEGVAVRNEAGALVLSVAGRVEGDVIDRGARPAKVTTELGSTVGGDIDVAGADSEVRVGGTAEGVRFRRGGTMTVGPAGTVRGPVSSDGGELVAEAEQGEGETAAEALERAFRGEVVEEGGTPTLRTRKEGEPARTVGAPGTAASAPDGAWDVGVESTPGGGVRVVRALALRSRVYEALPSVLLGLNAPTRYEERRAAGRSAKGGWARVEASRGHWKADGSASREESGVGLAYRHRRHGVQVGLSGAWGEGARVGASLHHRRGSATVVQGGEVALYGTGAGVSGTWSRGEAYLDVQAELTWYEADLTSSSRGVLGKDVSGQGHALGVEAGQRLALSGLPELVLTPRAGLVHSQVDVRGFTDATGSRVSVRDARAFLGRVGVEAEARHGGSAQSRVYGTVDLEHEFETARAAEVSGRRLRSEADATWLRLGLNGEHASEDGGWSFAGGMHYATTSGGGYALGGGLSLGLRF